MRVHVRALIVVDGRIVVAVEGRQGRRHLTLPGGRVDRAEDTRTALVREVREETGLVVEPGPLLYVAEVFNPYRVEELVLVFRADVTSSCDGSRFDLVDPASVDETVLPPILPPIARDLEEGDAGRPRWLGNVFDGSLSTRAERAGSTERGTSTP